MGVRNCQFKSDLLGVLTWWKNKSALDAENRPRLSFTENRRLEANDSDSRPDEDDFAHPGAGASRQTHLAIACIRIKLLCHQ